MLMATSPSGEHSALAGSRRCPRFFCTETFLWLGSHTDRPSHTGSTVCILYEGFHHKIEKQLLKLKVDVKLFDTHNMGYFL